ncbi:MAG: sigma-70 family RNA polymerase sigma factor [bacterium]|nr:sigma-70 family RNA polymerase sigma factor [bacterium]
MRPPEEELVERIADGDSESLSELYDRFSGMLLGLATKILGNPSDAEEVLQEVFVQVWKQASRYQRSRSSVSTWLVLIARSRSIDRLRSRNVKLRTAREAQRENPRIHASPEGLGNVLMEERHNRLARALAELPEEQREVLEMAYYRGMTQREVSEVTGTPLGTVKTRTLLAMKKLRIALKDEVEDLL